MTVFINNLEETGILMIFPQGDPCKFCFLCREKYGFPLFKCDKNDSVGCEIYQKLENPKQN
jgi:hypothetical protein